MAANPFDQFDAPAARKTSTPEEFAEVYGPAAQRAAKALNVDPQVLLGQWGLETGWGKSVIPGTNNLGNIKDFAGASMRDNYARAREARTANYAQARG
jgi:flagellum-specific peptidoglycan hydrolase FlgJ